MEEQTELRRQLFGGRIGRRQALRGGALAGAGLTAAALIGCGDDDDDDGGAAPSGATAGPTQAAQPAAPAEPDFVRDARADGAPYPYGYTETTKAPKAGGTLVV